MLTAPGSGPSSETSSVKLGIAFKADSPGNITGVRFYKAAQNSGTHTIALWKTDGTQLCNRDGDQREHVWVAAGLLRCPSRHNDQHHLYRFLHCAQRAILLHLWWASLADRA